MDEIHVCEKKGPDPVNQDALNRLRRAAGQIKGIIRMVEEEKYCIDILTQISAARAALNRAGMVVLKRHIETCVSNAIKAGGRAQEEIIEELMTALNRQQL